MRNLKFESNRIPSPILSALRFVRKWRLIMLVGLTLVSSIAILMPLHSVKGLVKNTGIQPQGPMSIDDGRIVVTDQSSAVRVYDFVSGTIITVPVPAGGPIALPPVIYGNKLVIAGGTSVISQSTIYYCVLTPAACGAWIAIATTTSSFTFLAAHGSLTAKADLVVWPVSGGFDYYRFSSAATTFVPTPTQALYPSTNGEIIAFTAKPTAASTSLTLMYYDTSPPGSIVDTSLPAAGVTSISQGTIVFEDNSTLPACISGTGSTVCDYHIRYYDTIRAKSSPAGNGPLGFLRQGNQAIWGDRIVFNVSESSLGFDCNGNGSMFSGDVTTGTFPDICIRWWNIRSPTLALFTDPSAAPSGTASLIYDKTIAFGVSTFNPVTSTFSSTLEYMTLPMKGDINQDGLVNIQDLSAVGACFGQVIKGMAC